MRLTIHSLLTALIFLVLSKAAMAQTVQTNATVTTDQPDYAPGSTANISGSGFTPSEQIQVQVINLTNPDDLGDEHAPWTVEADENGNFTTTWLVTEDEAGTTLLLTATGLSSGLVAQHTFTDAHTANSVTVVYQAGTATYGTSASVTYNVSVGSTGSGSGSSILTVSGLPSGATAVFASSGTATGNVSFSNGSPTGTDTLTITTKTNTPAATTIFTVTASGGTTPSNTNSITVNKKSVVITGVTAVSKIYDATSTATLNNGSAAVSGATNNDSVTFTAGTGAFASQYVGTRAVTASGYALTTSGIATNYSLSTQPVVPNASITARSVLITNVSAANKTYTGTTTATLSGGAVSNTVSGDTVTFTAGTGAFASKNIGTWAVTASSYALTTSGVSTNYALSAQPVVPNATISTTNLGITANNDTKTYGSTKTYGTGQTAFTSSGLQNGETIATVTISASGGTNANSPVATYNLIPSAATGGTFAATNYSITYNNGTLTVNKATATAAILSSLNPSGYKASVNFTITLPSDATGFVFFTTTNAPFSTNLLSSGSATSLSITNLPRGTNVITALYSGDSNYLGSTNTLAQIVTNHPPVAASFTVTNDVNSFKKTISALLANVTDVDGDNITLTGLSTSTNGVTLFTNAVLIQYRNTNNVNDQFSYTVYDGFGGSATGVVSIVFNPFGSGNPQTGQSGTVTPFGGHSQLKFYGIPNYHYGIQRTTNMASPWVTIVTATVSTNGVLNFDDDYSDLGTPPASAYYRLVWLP